MMSSEQREQLSRLLALPCPAQLLELREWPRSSGGSLP